MASNKPALDEPTYDPAYDPSVYDQSAFDQSAFDQSYAPSYAPPFEPAPGTPSGVPTGAELGSGPEADGAHSGAGLGLGSGIDTGPGFDIGPGIDIGPGDGLASAAGADFVAGPAGGPADLADFVDPADPADPVDPADLVDPNEGWSGERGAELWEEWNPTEDSAGPVRGKHRIGKQRGGTMARSGAVLGVGVIAAVGAGGMASAKDRPAPPISMPDLAHLADQMGELPGKLPAVEDLPGIGSLLADDSAPEAAEAAEAPGADQPLSRIGLSAEDAANGVADAGEALRARILQQAEHQQSAADSEARDAVVRAAADKAADEAAKRKAEADAGEKAKAEAAAKAKAEKEAAAKDAADKKAAAAAQEKASEKGLVKPGAAYTLPVGSYTLTAGFGQSGDMWSANHTGQDFAAPTGTPIKAVHGGTITQAGWAGSYGYRTVLTLDDGTELWFCHQSSIAVNSGKVQAGDVIGRVGATGNVTGPHLHLEVRPGGGTPVDPMAWLREHGMKP
ncbi:M23 family metallopeptidase [Streptomyces sp. NPDC050610]|uniref:M23 family metallopeptidase n=1 Tax=Streptomyces sp. NPDC050610 TaxID=3157097 RepID=UPI0034468A15